MTAATEETQTLAHACKVICQRKDQAWLKKWEVKGISQAMKYYQKLEIQPTTNIKVMPEMNVSRKVLGWLIAARSGYGHFADYYKKFGYEEEDIQCKCGQRRLRLHLSPCANARPHKAKLFSIIEKRPLTTKSSSRDNPGCENDCKIDSKNGAISEEKSTQRTDGIIEGVFGGLIGSRSCDYPVLVQQQKM